MTRPPIHYLKLRILTLYQDYLQSDDKVIQWELGALLRVLIHTLKETSGSSQTQKFLMRVASQMKIKDNTVPNR